MKHRAALAFAAMLLLGGASAAAAQTKLEAGVRTKGQLHAKDTVLAGHGPSQTFEIDASLEGTFTVTLESYDFDAYLRVETSAGKAVREDDNGLLETNARVVFTAEPKVKYRVVVASAKDAAGGEFFVTVVPGELPELKPKDRLAARIEFRRTGYARAMERKDARAAARHKFAEAWWLMNSGEKLDEAIVQFEAAAALARSVNDDDREAKCLRNLALAHWYKPDVKKAREYYQQLLALAKKSQNKALELEALKWIGSASYELAEYKLAAENLQAALALARELKSAPEEGDVLARMGFVLWKTGETAPAAEHFEKTLVIAQQIRNSPPALDDTQEVRLAAANDMEVVATEGLGELAFQRKDFRKARSLFQKQLTLARDMHDDGREKAARAHVRQVDDALEKSGEVNPDAAESRPAVVRKKIERAPVRAAAVADLAAANKLVDGASSIGKASIGISSGQLVLTVKLGTTKFGDSATHADMARVTLILFRELSWLGSLAVKVYVPSGALVMDSTVKIEKVIPYLEIMDDPFEARRMSDWWNQMRD